MQSSQTTQSSVTQTDPGTGYGDGRLRNEINSDSDDEAALGVTEGDTDYIDDDTHGSCGDWLNEKLSVNSACSDFLQNIAAKYQGSDACLDFFCSDCKYAHYCDSSCNFC